MLQERAAAPHGAHQSVLPQLQLEQARILDVEVPHDGAVQLMRVNQWGYFIARGRNDVQRGIRCLLRQLLDQVGQEDHGVVVDQANPEVRPRLRRIKTLVTVDCGPDAGQSRGDVDCQLDSSRGGLHRAAIAHEQLIVEQRPQLRQ
ncbi:hypothetical protein FQZ97_735810 [compost metagenome]